MVQIKDLPEITIVNANDLLVVQTSINSITSKVTKANLLKELESGLTTKWNAINEGITAYTPLTGTKSFINSNAIVSLSSSATNGNEIEIFNNSANSIKISFNDRDGILPIKKLSRLVFFDNQWIDVNNNFRFLARYPSGAILSIEGELKDVINNYQVSQIGLTIPSSVNGLDNVPALRFNGTNQELNVPYFLQGTTGVTLYLVCSISNSSNYNLIRTRSGQDEYWRFSGDGNGYIGSFLTFRQNSYPASMPSNGNYLFSIHVNSAVPASGNIPASDATYDFRVNNVSKGVRNFTYNSGDRFRICPIDTGSSFPRLFSGDISLIRVYPYYIAPTSTLHQQMIDAIKINFPSLGM